VYNTKQGKRARNTTTDEYRDELMPTLLPEGAKMFRKQGLSSWVLQQDNDPAHNHANATVQEWDKSHAGSARLLANWPPCSPELNPIQNAWAYVQRKVGDICCKTFDELKAAVSSEFKSIPQAMLMSLCASMPDGMAKVVEAGGGRIKY
jgi:hypothetical protein